MTADEMETSIAVFVITGFQIIHELEPGASSYVRVVFLVSIHLATGVQF